MLLVGKPDQKTEHMASLVARQRDNREGYNVRTGKVIQEFGAAERSGVKMEKSQRGVPKHLLNQLKELLEERGALALNTIPDVYEEEFGYTWTTFCHRRHRSMVALGGGGAAHTSVLCFTS